MKTWFLAFAVLILAAACIADAHAHWHVTPLYIVALPPVPPDCEGLRYVFVVTSRAVNIAMRGNKEIK